MVHAQAAHMINIYELGNENESTEIGINGIHKENGTNGTSELNDVEHDLKDEISQDSPYKEVSVFFN